MIMERSSAIPVEMLNTKDRTCVVDLWMSVAKCERKFNLVKTFFPKLTKNLELRLVSLRSSWF